MKGRIDTDGILAIERAGKLKTQACPYDSSSHGCGCGDWCPMFREPEETVPGLEVKIDICHNTLYFEGFEDER